MIIPRWSLYVIEIWLWTSRIALATSSTAPTNFIAPTNYTVSTNSTARTNSTAPFAQTNVDDENVDTPVSPTEKSWTQQQQAIVFAPEPTATSEASVHNVTYQALTHTRSENGDWDWVGGSDGEYTTLTSIAKDNCSFPGLTGSGERYVSCCSQNYRNYHVLVDDYSAALLTSEYNSWTTYVTTVEVWQEPEIGDKCANVRYFNESMIDKRTNSYATTTMSVPVVRSRGTATVVWCNFHSTDCDSISKSFYSKYDEFYYTQSTIWSQVNVTAEAELYLPKECQSIMDPAFWSFGQGAFLGAGTYTVAATCSQTCTLDADGVDVYYAPLPSTPQDLCAMPTANQIFETAKLPPSMRSVLNTIQNGSVATMDAAKVYLDFHRPKIVLPFGCWPQKGNWVNGTSVYAQNLLISAHSSDVSHRLPEYPVPRRLNFRDLTESILALSAQGRPFLCRRDVYDYSSTSTAARDGWRAGKCQVEIDRDRSYMIEVPALSELFPWPDSCKVRRLATRGIFDPPKTMNLASTIEEPLMPTFSTQPAPGATPSNNIAQATTGPSITSQILSRNSAASEARPLATLLDDHAAGADIVVSGASEARPLPSFPDDHAVGADNNVPAASGTRPTAIVVDEYTVGADIIVPASSGISILGHGILEAGTYTRKDDGMGLRYGTDGLLTIYGHDTSSTKVLAMPAGSTPAPIAEIDGHPVYAMGESGFVQVGGGINAVLGVGEVIVIAGTTMTVAADGLTIHGSSSTFIPKGVAAGTFAKSKTSVANSALLHASSHADQLSVPSSALTSSPQATSQDDQTQGDRKSSGAVQLSGLLWSHASFVLLLHLSSYMKD